MPADAANAPKRRKWEAADAVIATSVLLLVAVFGVFGLLVWQGYEETLRRAEVRSEAGARAMAELSGWAIVSGLALLDAPAAPGLPPPAPLPETIAPPAAALYDAAGTLTGPSAPGLPQTLAGTTLLDELRAGSAWAASTRADEDLLLIGRRREEGDGFTGAAVLALPPALVETLWSMLALGVESTVSLIRTDGKVVARFPRPDRPLDLAGLPVLERLTGAQSGVYRSSASPADGVARIVGFAAMPQFGLVAVASVSRDAVLAELWQAVSTVLYLMLPIGIALMVGSFIAARLLRRSRRAEQRLEAALEENSLLLREIHHRVKNNLQSVNALLNLHDLPAELKADLGHRLGAMSAVHEHIYRSDNFGVVELDDYLRTLLAKLRQGLGADIRFLERFEPMQVTADMATPLGLIFSEAVSNAIKHAFAGGRAGELTLILERLGDGRARLSVADDGPGYDPARPARGIGHKLIRALTVQLSGETAITPTPSGTRFELLFPLPG